MFNAQLTIGSFVVSQFHPSALPFLLLAGSLLMNQLPSLLRCLMNYLHLPSVISGIHSSFDSLDGVCRVGSPY